MCVIFPFPFTFCPPWYSLLPLVTFFWRLNNFRILACNSASLTTVCCLSCFQELVRHMMQREPSHRLSAEEYLIQQRGKVFPEYFYTFLKLYLQRFAMIPIVPPDDRVGRWECSCRWFVSDIFCLCLSSTSFCVTRAEKLNTMLNVWLMCLWCIKKKSLYFSHRLC